MYGSKVIAVSLNGKLNSAIFKTQPFVSFNRAHGVSLMETQVKDPLKPLVLSQTLL